MTGVHARYASTDTFIHEKIVDAAGQRAQGWSQVGDRGNAFFAYDTAAEAEIARARIAVVPGVVACFTQEGTARSEF